MSSRQSILDLISRDPTVKVGPHKIPLTRPTQEQMAQAAAFSAEVYPERNTGDQAAADALSPGELTSRAIRVGQHCLVVCLPGDLENEQEAFALIQSSGGLMGELTQTAMSLCGLGGGLVDLAEHDPTLA